MTDWERLRREIRSGSLRGARLRALLEHSAPSVRPPDAPGYDSLDAFADALLLPRGVPEPSREREPEMVMYQPTPVRVVLEMIDTAHFAPDDLFYDIGSGLGQAAILTNLIGEVRVKGVEFDPAYCEYARKCAARLSLTGFEVVNADARDVDYSDGTVFYLYTPFTGRMLREVLAKLPTGCRVFTYGPCTAELQPGANADSLRHFRSLPSAL